MIPRWTGINGIIRNWLQSILIYAIYFSDREYVYMELCIKETWPNLFDSNLTVILVPVIPNKYGEIFTWTR